MGQEMAPLSGQMDTAGANGMTGFWNGLARVAQQVANWVSTFIQNMVNSINSLLGIRSPSTVLDEIGQNTWLGWIQGAEKQAGAVYAQLDEMGGEIVARAMSIQSKVVMTQQAATATAAAGAAGGGGGGTVEVDYGSVPDSVWNALRAMGYRGNPNDNKEAFYVSRSDLARAEGTGSPSTTTSSSSSSSSSGGGSSGGGGLREVDYGTVSATVWDALKAMGYRGDPNDNKEAFYVTATDLARAMGLVVSSGGGNTGRAGAHQNPAWWTPPSTPGVVPQREQRYDMAYSTGGGDYSIGPPPPPPVPVPTGTGSSTGTGTTQIVCHFHGPVMNPDELRRCIQDSNLRYSLRNARTGLDARRR
jgi:hypothetical protein